jgi:hypothetical protein
VRLVPWAATYGLTEHRHVTQAFRGQPMVSDARTDTRLGLALDAADSNLTLVAVVESVTVQGDAGLPPEAVTGALGARIHATVTGGEIVGPASADSGNAVVERLLMELPNLLPRLPCEGAAPNATWNDTTETHGWTAGLPLTIRTRAVHHAESWIERGGLRVLPMTSRATYEVSGEGERDGQWISVSGHGRRVTRRLLTPDGRTTESVASDTLDAILALPDAGTTIPVTQTTVDSVRLVNR